MDHPPSPPPLPGLFQEYFTKQVVHYQLPFAAAVVLLSGHCDPLERKETEGHEFIEYPPNRESSVGGLPLDTSAVVVGHK